MTTWQVSLDHDRTDQLMSGQVISCAQRGPACSPDSIDTLISLIWPIWAELTIQISWRLINSYRSGRVESREDQGDYKAHPQWNKGPGLGNSWLWLISSIGLGNMRYWILKSTDFTISMWDGLLIHSTNLYLTMIWTIGTDLMTPKDFPSSKWYSKWLSLLFLPSYMHGSEEVQCPTLKHKMLDFSNI